MRALILVAGAAFCLAACGKNGEAGQTANVGDTLTAENIVANDVTAIDAVTGDAANMAADVDVNFTNEQLTSAGNSTTGRPSARPARPAARTAPAAANTATPAPEPAGNATANATQ